MYKQYTTKHQTEVGIVEIERTYKKGAVDSILVTAKGKVMELPKSMWQTDQTILRKVCAMLRGA